jgi:peroxiredoxin Q/BCP
MTKLKIGEIAPEFTLWDEDKKEHTLSDYRGQWVLIYFYPKDNTPGCTVEALMFRDLYDEFKKLDVKVFGISKDTAPSHKRFIEKYALPFTLLCDQQREIAELYGSLGLKKFMGKEYMGVLRNSYLIDPEGKLVRVYEGVTPKTHASEVLEDVKALRA